MKKLLPSALFFISGISSALDPLPAYRSNLFKALKHGKAFAFTITKISDQQVYNISSTAVITITLINTGSVPVNVDKITDELPPDFTFQGFHPESDITNSNSVFTPGVGATGILQFISMVSNLGISNYMVPAGGSRILKYFATTCPYNAVNLTTTAWSYLSNSSLGSAQHTLSVLSTLPVQLTDFSAARKNGGILISWKTGNETAAVDFEIQRAKTPGSFESVGRMAANATFKYSFFDSVSVPGMFRYRLKIEETGFASRYSTEISMTQLTAHPEPQLIFPNPFQQKLTVQVQLDQQQTLQVRLLTVRGSIAKQFTAVCRRGTSYISFDDLGLLSHGLYILQLVSNDAVYHHKLMKQK